MSLTEHDADATRHTQRPSAPSRPHPLGHDPLEHDPVLHRAVGSLRDEPDRGWEEASEQVRETLRRTTRRARRLVATTTDLRSGAGFEDGSRLWVSERVVLDVLRRTVSGTPAAAPVAIALEVDTDADGDRRCTGVRCDLVVGYGVGLADLTARLREVVTLALADLLGPAERVVDLHVVDVEADDPSL